MESAMRKTSIVCIATAILLLTASPLLAGGPPCNKHDLESAPSKKCEYHWVKAVGDEPIYCTADPGKTCGEKVVTVTATLDEGYKLDTRWTQNDLDYKGYWFKSENGHEQGMAMTIPGLYVHVTGDNNPHGVRYIIFTEMTQDRINPRKYIIRARVYCHAGSLTVNKFETSGGCNTSGEAWVKIDPKDKSQ